MFKGLKEHEPGFLRWKLLIFWALLTFVGLLLTISLYAGSYAVGEPATLLEALNSQMVRFQVWAAFAVLIVGVDLVYRRYFRSWFLRFPVHLVTALVWSAVTATVTVVLMWLFEGLTSSQPSGLGTIAAATGVGSVVTGVIGYKIILTTNYALDFNKKFNDEKNKSEVLERQLAQAQLQALKMQLQPHFLFNTLNSLSSLALEDPRQTVHMITRLGDFLRMTVDSNGTQTVSLEQELEFLKNYLEIEKVRFRDRLEPVFEIDPETLGADVPNLLLQPAVENAIKHGVSKSMSAGRILISALREGERLVLKIENDGPVPNGRPGTEVREGVGIANTRERLKQIYGEDFELDFELLPRGGGRLMISVPLRPNGTEDDH
ncbi:MAG: histidine kinase [Acidobacteriota bacterium]|nr:MAG: histidine kinase [Acidobacteriota bacterium]